MAVPVPRQSLHGFHAPDGDFRFFAEDGFFKLDGEVEADVAALLHARCAAAAAAHVEHLAEEIAEDVADILAGKGIAVEAGGAETGVAVAIVGSALLRIAEHLIGLAAGLEASLPLRRCRDCGRDGTAWPACDRRLFSS